MTIKIIWTLMFAAVSTTTYSAQTSFDVAQMGSKSNSSRNQTSKSQPSGNRSSGNRSSGSQSLGDQSSGSRSSGSQSSGSQSLGSQSSGSQSSGSQSLGSQSSGSQSSGSQSSGSQSSGSQSSGSQSLGGQSSGSQSLGSQSSGNQDLEQSSQKSTSKTKPKPMTDTTTSYVYITNYAASQNGYTLNACAINSSNGMLTCQPLTLSSVPQGATLQGVAIDNGSAYISVVSGGYSFGVLSCTIEGTTLSNCTMNLSGTPGRAVSATVYNGYFYAVNNTQNNVLVCPLASWPNNCTTTGTNLNGPSAGVAFYNNGSTTYAYITNYSSNTSITMCEWSASTGLLSNCQMLSNPTPASSPEMSSPDAIVIQGNYLYIANESTKPQPILACSITPSSGMLTSCTSFTDSALTNPFGLGAYNNYLYVSNFYMGSTSNSVFSCLINSTNGSIQSCQSNSGFNSPVANMAFVG